MDNSQFPARSRHAATFKSDGTYAKIKAEGEAMIDRYTKVVLTIIAVNLTVIAITLTLTVSDNLLKTAVPEVWAQNIMPVRVVGGKLDYETDVTGGPTLKVCMNC